MSAPTPNAADLAAITAAAKTYNVPLPLSLAVAAQESGISQTNSSGGVTTSSSGALGIYQLEPDTAAGLGVNPTNEAQNIIGGNKYLGQLLAQYGGDQTKTLEAYNAGPGAAAAAGYNLAKLPAQTQAYVPSVQALAAQYGGTVTPTSGGGLLGALPSFNPLGVGFAIGQALGGGAVAATAKVVGGANGGVTNDLVSAVFNQLTVTGFTEKATQFFVIMLLIIGGFIILVPRGAAA